MPVLPHAETCRTLTQKATALLCPDGGSGQRAVRTCDIKIEQAPERMGILQSDGRTLDFQKRGIDDEITLIPRFQVAKLLVLGGKSLPDSLHSRFGDTLRASGTLLGARHDDGQAQQRLSGIGAP